MEETMNHASSYLKAATGLASVMLAGWLLAGCSQTAASGPNIVQRAQGETSAAPPPSGFLGSDYSLLQPGAPGSGQEAMLAYTNPNANFASYNKVMIAPVTFWADSDSKVSSADQQTLCNYFYNVLQKDFSQNFTVVDEPGPGVAKLTVALSDATSAVPVLRTISVVVPQAHALNLIKMGLTGTYAFVGSATGEAKLTDSESGQLLAAWADQRFGTAAVRNATVWQWGDADNAMNYWAKRLDQRLTTLGVQNTGPLAASN
jgi:Protein of unknown function (DUF3313)